MRLKINSKFRTNVGGSDLISSNLNKMSNASYAKPVAGEMTISYTMKDKVFTEQIFDVTGFDDDLNKIAKVLNDEVKALFGGGDKGKVKIVFVVKV